jgi:hypothetical protein
VSNPRPPIPPQDPAIDAAIVAVLREYGPMTKTEIAVALDLKPHQVDTAINRCRDIVCGNTIPPLRYTARAAT